MFVSSAMRRIVVSKRIIADILADPVTYYRTFIENVADDEMGFRNTVLFGVAISWTGSIDYGHLRAEHIARKWREKNAHLFDE